MAIYVDMLILVNFIVDYFLLKATTLALRTYIPLWRTFLAAAVSALFSLYIFLPKSPVLIQLGARFAFCAITVSVAGLYKNKRFFVKACLVFFGVTFAYAGSMTALYSLIDTKKMAVKNSVVYFDVSPFTLIISSAVFYFVFTFINFIAARKNDFPRFTVTLFEGNKKIILSGLLDTGNTLRDPFFERPVIIVNKEDVKRVIGDGEKSKNRLCLLPCATVSGKALLYGYRLDKAVVQTGKTKQVIEKAVIAFADEQLEKNTAVLNLQLLN